MNENLKYYPRAGTILEVKFPNGVWRRCTVHGLAVAEGLVEPGAKIESLIIIESASDFRRPKLLAEHDMEP